MQRSGEKSELSSNRVICIFEFVMFHLWIITVLHQNINSRSIFFQIIQVYFYFCLDFFRVLNRQSESHYHSIKQSHEQKMMTIQNSMVFFHYS